jgi:ParB family chromosome partitioning protein
MRKALGKGLDALLPQNKTAEVKIEGGRSGVNKIPLDSIRPNHLQPRKSFDAQKLSELSASIKEHGLAQPILVSFDSISNSYELIAGERRLRASKLAGLKTIDAVVKTPKDDRERLALALIENIQRDDLNAIDTAEAYKKLMAEFGVNQTDLAKVVGKSKSAVSNTLRLLDLSDDMRKAVQIEQITEGHARALLMVSDAHERSKLFKIALEQHLSVRRVEALAQEIQGGKKLDTKKAKTTRKLPKPADIKDLETRLQQAFGTRVEIRARKDMQSGRIVIHFYSLDDFDNIVKALKK